MKKRKQESRVVRYEERQTINSCLYEHKSQDRGKKKGASNLRIASSSCNQELWILNSKFEPSTQLSGDVWNTLADLVHHEVHKDGMNKQMVLPNCKTSG